MDIIEESPTPTADLSHNEQLRLLTDEGEANVPLQTDDPEFNDTLAEVRVLKLFNDTLN